VNSYQIIALVYVVLITAWFTHQIRKIIRERKMK
jgi:hypothetical protein